MPAAKRASMKTSTPKTICRDPTIRPMVFQLAHLFGVAGHQYDVVHYMADEAACKERSPNLG